MEHPTGEAGSGAFVGSAGSVRCGAERDSRTVFCGTMAGIAALAILLAPSSARCQDRIAIVGEIAHACENMELSNPRLQAMNEFMGVSTERLCDCYARMITSTLTDAEAYAFTHGNGLPVRLNAAGGAMIKYCALTEMR
jgi:hypothetical protein